MRHLDGRKLTVSLRHFAPVGALRLMNHGMNHWEQWIEIPMGGPTGGNGTETFVGSMELIEEHLDDDKDGVTSMGFKPNGSLAIKDAIRVRRSSKKSKPSDRFDL